MALDDVVEELTGGGGAGHAGKDLGRDSGKGIAGVILEPDRQVELVRVVLEVGDMGAAGGGELDKVSHIGYRIA